tara:strand:- start:10740 stop:11537 length:798 start_codon:yes stop_codon:yes gene_type:complete
MQSIKKLDKITKQSVEKCDNCQYELNETFKYCPNCSQKVAFSYRLSELFSHFLSDYFTFDSKIGRSLLPLLTRPGYLTKQFLIGKRESYIQPLRLFIFLSIIFFLSLSLSVSLNGDDSAVVSSVNPSNGFGDAFWDRFFGSLLPKLFFFLLPLFSLILALLYRRKRENLLTHFLFALHFHSTVFLVGIIYELLSLGFAQMELYILNSILLISAFFYLLYYLYRGLMIVYSDNWKKTFLKMGILGILYALLLVTSTFILFALSINY